MTAATVRLGAIGAGWWATSNHFPLFAARDDVELVGVCGKGDGLEAVREKFGFGFATEDATELLDADIDAVVISTPHDLHHPLAAQALDRGLHVLCEKPMTLHADEAWDLAARAERAGTVFLVPYGWNYKPFTVAAKRMLDAGAIGEIQYALCHMASPTRGLFGTDPTHMLERWNSDTAPDPTTWSSPEHGGGYAHGQITHSSALLFWLTGLRAASVAGRAITAGAPVDLFDAGVIRFEGGALGSLSGAATLADGDKYQVDIRLFGTEGVLMIDVERERVTLSRYDGRREELVIPEGEGEYECLVPPARFIELITGASRENNSDVTVAARSVELIDALLRSSAAGGADTPV
ncbi:Gfo/Idh/MocA family protein [Microbacterium galbinum]|uniref:Gfo/Idh/MocA family oxidoreductase n=1 Tax=Microbacterium galbinum TaxID=2851646 RepID=A0ABY4IRW6_9MICO|nr:Gfo/Idh/MocA family oxidoreductase [Microbacterium galbinum]MBQ3359247.1 Gfo/Idh/MocA family oxidoreductase [Microbacterium sp.]MCK2029650.1 Gfo/Idh/MocA family oxidoreductase [Microbacterium galbinum]UPL14576.1 Gfo/Idh/MocA family oxidoreductase [Microbacterium galbinum]